MVAGAATVGEQVYVGELAKCAWLEDWFEESRRTLALLEHGVLVVEVELSADREEG